ncbi:MAG: hypothetical protein AVDCRST_MAG59-1191, partial [uncultured Thermomicrobiales bacterium]
DPPPPGDAEAGPGRSAMACRGDSSAGTRRRRRLQRNVVV